MMTYGSVCSGIEAASVAWHPLGWRAAWLAEIEPFPSTVLATHYPERANLGDMTFLAGYVMAGAIPAPDILVGGTPCQAFSVAGLRRGLNDDRGVLTLRYVELFNAIDDVRQREGKQPAIAVWENVPGVLSDATGAFGCFLAGLVGDDEEIAPSSGKWKKSGVVVGPERLAVWRVLDAQFFGVAQRRRRVFVVSVSLRHPGAWVIAEALLPVQKGLRGDTPPSRKTWKATPTVVADGAGEGGIGLSSIQFYQCGCGQQFPVDFGKYGCPNCEGDSGPAQVIPSRGCWWDGGQVSQTLDAVLAKGQTMPEKNRFPAVLQPIAFPANLIGTQYASASGVSPSLCAMNPTAIALQDVSGREKAQNGRGWNDDGTSYTVDTVATQGVAYAFAQNTRDEVRLVGGDGQVVGALAAQPGMKQTSYIAFGADNTSHEMAVRRLTPRECERLQGFPDDWTLVPVRGKPAADGPRYKSIGNSMAVPVMRFIGEKISTALQRAGGCCHA